jgi:hypothetical protein
VNKQVSAYFAEAWANLKANLEANLLEALTPLLICTSPSRSPTSADQRSQRYRHRHGTGRLAMELYEGQGEDILDGSTET